MQYIPVTVKDHDAEYTKQPLSNFSDYNKSSRTTVAACLSQDELQSMEHGLWKPVMRRVAYSDACDASVELVDEQALSVMFEGPSIGVTFFVSPNLFKGLRVVPQQSVEFQPS